MDFAQFSVREWRDAVLLAEDPQFVASVDAPLLGAGLDQRSVCGLIRAEEDRLLERLRVHHNEGQTE